MTKRELLSAIESHIEHYHRTTASEIQNLFGLNDEEVNELFNYLQKEGVVRQVNEPTYEWCFEETEYTVDIEVKQKFSEDKCNRINKELVERVAVIAEDLEIKDFQIIMHAKRRLLPSKKPFRFKQPQKLIVTATNEEVDSLCKEALRFWIEERNGRASIASIQRHLQIGFNRSGRIVDALQKMGYVTEIQDNELSVPLRVLVELEDLEKLFTEIFE